MNIKQMLSYTGCDVIYILILCIVGITAVLYSILAALFLFFVPAHIIYGVTPCIVTTTIILSLMFAIYFVYLMCTSDKRPCH